MVEPMSKIITSHHYQSIPARNDDWSAIDDDTYDGAEDSGCNMVGWGKTEAEAIADLERLNQEEQEYREHVESKGRDRELSI